jgi:hypothetical protein
MAGSRVPQPTLRSQIPFGATANPYVLARIAAARVIATCGIIVLGDHLWTTATMTSRVGY